jgi:DNA-binding NtrC family response regulator
MEDHRALRDTMAEVLEEEGFRITVETSLPGVSALVSSGDVDLVIADGWGPSHGTLQDAERDEILALGRTVPLLFYTGRAWASGSVDLESVRVLAKPADLDRLVDAAQVRIAEGLGDDVLAAARVIARLAAQDLIEKRTLIAVAPPAREQ